MGVYLFGNLSKNRVNSLPGHHSKAVVYRFLLLSRLKKIKKIKRRWVYGLGLLLKRYFNGGRAGCSNGIMRGMMTASSQKREREGT
jgi:hypothetical protein